MELERLVAALIRRWWILALAGLVGALIGQAGESSRSDLFTATATVEIAPNLDVFGSEFVLDRIVINEIGSIGSIEVVDAVIADLGEAGSDLDRDLDFALQQVTDTNLVNLSVSTEVEDVALEAANLWASRYIEESRAQERGDLEAELQSITGELEDARDARLALDAFLQESVVIRDEGLVSTYVETLLREPLVWDELVKADQDINRLVQQRSDTQVALSNILDSSMVSPATGPIEPTRTGNGLGPIEGLLIGLSLAAAAIAVMARDRVSHRAVDQFGHSVWPTSIRVARRAFVVPWRSRRIQTDITTIGTQVLTRLPDTKLQVVAFAGVDRERTQHLKSALADNFQSRGYSVSLMGDDNESAESRTVDGILDLLNAQDSVMFADHEELLSKRFNGRIVTVVAIDEHRDREQLVAQQISESLEISDAVLTVVAK